MVGTQTRLPLTHEKSEPKTTCSEGLEKNKELNELFNHLWTAADELRANSKLRSTQYSTPVLGILFLRYAYHKFEEATIELEKKYSGRNNPIRKLDYQAEGAIYLTETARYKYLLDLPEGTSIGKAIDDAMRSIEEENEELRDVLPKVYTSMEDRVLINLLKIFHKIPAKLDRDIFGKIYEYFLGKFAMTEGQRGGEFYTPTSIVRLIVEILEPYNGRILDPACGSGGMFVQSAKFVKDHLKNPYSDISVYGQEKAEDTVRLCKMNLAIHGLSGEIKQGNTYYEDVFNMMKQFDFVISNPPFNVNNVDKEAVKDDPRFQLGIPSVDNANYLWIQIFDSMLNGKGRAGFVMANSANDAGSSELEIRKKLIENDSVEAIISVAPHFFYTVGLAVTLWFLNKDKTDPNRNKILFIDAREIFQKIDRAHVEFTSQQIEFISNIVRVYRGKDIENNHGSLAILKRSFPDLKYQDVPGLCKIATSEEIRNQNYSLTSGRYVSIQREIQNIGNFNETIKKSYQELARLNEESNEIETEILRILSKLGDDR
jgi:type I restriction enzyme M protein